MDNLIEQDAKTFLLGYTLSLMSTAIIEFAGEVLFLSPDERRDLVSVNLLGGHIQYSEKRHCLNLFMIS